jgi:hypothetical protein
MLFDKVADQLGLVDRVVVANQDDLLGRPAHELVQKSNERFGVFLATQPEVAQLPQYAAESFFLRAFSAFVV